MIESTRDSITSKNKQTKISLYFTDYQIFICIYEENLPSNINEIPLNCIKKKERKKKKTEKKKKNIPPITFPLSSLYVDIGEKILPPSILPIHPPSNVTYI